MTQIQINLPKKLDKWVEIKKTILGTKDKRKTILKIIEEDMNSYDGIDIRDEF